MKKKRIEEKDVFLVHLSNQKTKNAVKEQIKNLSSNNDNNHNDEDITKLLQRDTLCTWLYNTWCVTCTNDQDNNEKSSKTTKNNVQLWEDLLLQSN